MPSVLEPRPTHDALAPIRSWTIPRSQWAEPSARCTSALTLRFPTVRFPLVGSPLGVVVLSVSPLASAALVIGAVTASLVAGNGTLVSFPGGTAQRTRAALLELGRRVGNGRVALVTGADLARDPDAELGWLASVGAERTRLEGDTAVRHAAPACGGAAACASPEDREALVALFSSDFPLDEWDARIASVTGLAGGATEPGETMSRNT